MRAEELNQRITIQVHSTLQNKNGFTEDVWQDTFLCYASVRGLSASEYFAAQAVQQEESLLFTIRYCKKAASITPKEHRIVFQGKVYDIYSVGDVRFQHDKVELKARYVGKVGAV